MFYISCSFRLVVCREKNILPILNNSQESEPHVFWPLGVGAACFLAPWNRSRSRSKKIYQEPEPPGKKIGSRSRMKKKVRRRSQSRLKISRLPSPAFVKYPVMLYFLLFFHHGHHVNTRLFNNRIFKC